MRSLQRVQLWIRQLSMFQPTRQTIAVIGTTGVGKSQLGIELSKALHGEVINADSMQVREYANVDLLTTWANVDAWNLEYLLGLQGTGYHYQQSDRE